MKDTQQKLPLGNLGRVSLFRYSSAKYGSPDYYKKEAAFRKSVSEKIPLSSKAIKMLDDNMDLYAFPEYESDTERNILKILNKRHGRYFFRLYKEYPENFSGIAWIGGYTIAEVEKFVMDIMSDDVWMFLFSHKFWASSNVGYNLGETPFINIARLEPNFALGHVCPIQILDRKNVEVARLRRGPYHLDTQPKSNDKRMQFVDIPFAYKIINEDSKLTESIAYAEFWELGGEHPESLNHVKRMYANLLCYNYPKAAFKVSHKVGTKTLVVNYNGARLSEIEKAKDLAVSLLQTKYHYWGKKTDSTYGEWLRIFPYHARNIEFVEDKSLRLPSAAETRQRILFKVQGLRKKLELLNESNKKTLPLPENF